MRMSKEELLKKCMEEGVKRYFFYDGDIFQLPYYRELLQNFLQNEWHETIYQANSDRKIWGMLFGMNYLVLSPPLNLSHDDDPHFAIYEALQAATS